MRFSEKLHHLLQLSPRFLIAAVVFVAVAGHGQDQLNSSFQFAKVYFNGNIITYKQADDPEKYVTVNALPLQRCAFL